MWHRYHISMIQRLKHPVKKAHYVGTSVVVTIDPIHVKRLQIDEATFFVQKPVEDGILLQRCELQFGAKNEGGDNEN